jgi:hypothetical protein
MMDKTKQQLTLDRPAIYQIKVPGELDRMWSDWAGEIAVTVDCEEGGLSVTTLTGTFDQAALYGLLRRLYSLGLPLISVNYVEGDGCVEWE